LFLLYEGAGARHEFSMKQQRLACVSAE
jgi:hypothetical protein